LSIRTKIGLILICAVLCFSAAEYAIQRAIVVPGFLDLERAEALQDSRRVTDAIVNEIMHLQTFCRDWAAWDDTYEFIESPSDPYIDSNLPPATFINNRLNLMYLYDRKGEKVWGRAYDSSFSAPLSIAEFPDRFPHDHPLVPGEDETGNPPPVSGLIMTELGPMIIASCPIVRSNNDGPARGAFIMGRLIGPEMMGVISHQTGVNSTLEVIGNTGQETRIEIAGENKLYAHTVYPAIGGEPAFLISAVLPRPIAAKSKEILQQGILSILAVGLGVLVLVLFTLKRHILDPLARFTQHTRIIAETGDFSRRIAFSRRKDEIGILERRFDDMVARIEESARKLSDSNGQLQEDIEKRKQTEAALRESEERFRTLVEQAADAVFVHDANGRLRDVNRVACERLGYSREELLELTVSEIDPDSERRNDLRAYWEDIAQTAPLTIESQHRHRTGRLFPVEIRISPVRLKGELLVLALARDISERRQMEERLRYAHKMEAISTLTAGISHNFNNMLSIIIGNTELAMDSVSDSRTARMLKNIENASLRARDMVWKLIRFSQQTFENQQPVSPADAVGGRLALLEPSLPESIRFEKRIDPDCPRVTGNPEQIGLIVSNLWTNAVEAMSGTGGRLTITLQTAGPDDPAAPRESSDLATHVRLSVEDTGRGIAPADTDRIFDPYFTTKDIVEGAGLGLSIVYGIVKNSGGSIRVDSRPGEGTRVDILMPVHPPVQSRTNLPIQN